MHRVIVTLAGITPLLMNRMPRDVLIGMRDKKNKKKYVAPELPRDEAAAKYHQLEDGTPIIPAEMFMSCLIGAGTFVKLDGKRQMSTAKSSLLPGFLSLEVPYFPLLDPATKRKPKAAEWEVDIRQGRNPNGGEGVCLVRPRFDAWKFDVSMVLDTDSLSEGVYRNLIDIAGSRFGLGDFRPQRKGIFGKFKVERWDSTQLSPETNEEVAAGD